MENTILQKLLVLATAVLFASCNDDTSSTSESSEEESSSQSSESSSETSSIDGAVFAQELHNQLLKDHTYYTTYNEIRYMFVYSDVYPDKDPDDEDQTDYILDFYSKEPMHGTWDGGTTYNREHVWCVSHSNGVWGRNDTRSAGTDLLHIRPCDTMKNSARGNKPFGVVDNATSEDSTGKYDGKTFEPVDISKGDVARELMYLFVHYGTNFGGNTNSYTGELDITKIVSTSEGTEEAAFNLLLEWNELDPVASTEITLNDYAEKVQGNRNPFIDHPEYATTIWGQA